MKKILVLIGLSMIILSQTLTIFGESNEENLEDHTLENSQDEVLEAFFRMVDYFGVSDNDDINFPDYYASEYIDSNNNLIISLTTDDEEVIDMLIKILAYDKVEFRLVENTKKDYDYVHEIVMANYKKLHAKGIELISVSFDSHLNQEVIRVKDLKDEDEVILNELFKSDEIIYRNIPSFKRLNKTKDFEIVMNKLIEKPLTRLLTGVSKGVIVTRLTYHLFIESKNALATMNGHITEIDIPNRRVLVEGIDQTLENSPKTAMWFVVSKETIIRDKNYKIFTLEMIKMGQQVLAYTSSGILQTYPGKTMGDLIIIDTD